MSQLNKQRAIDALAMILIIGLACIIGFIASTLIAAAFISGYFPEQDHQDNPVEGIFMALAWLLSLIFLSPLWLWLAIRLRRLMNWPKGAFCKVPK